MAGQVSDCIGLSEETENSIWQWSLVLHGCNTFTLYIMLLNNRSKQLFALVADCTRPTCEKQLVIEKFRSSSWIPSTVDVKASQSIPNVFVKAPYADV